MENFGPKKGDINRVKCVKKNIENFTNQQCKTFSLPYGQKVDFNDFTKKILKKYGYECCLLNYGHYNKAYDNTFFKKRISIGPEFLRNMIFKFL